MNYSPPDRVTPTPLEQRAAHFQALTLHDVLFWIRKWKWEFLIVAVTTVLATLVYIMLFRDPSFVSEARLFVRVSQEQTAPRTLVTQEGTTLLTPATSDVTSEIDLFLNSDLASDVIDNARLLEAMETPPPAPTTMVERLKQTYKAVTARVRATVDEVAYALGVKVRLSPREALIRQIRMSLGVENSRGSNVVVVSMKWPDRDVPKALLQYYLDAFLMFRLDAFQSNEAEFFERQVEASRNRIADLETHVAALRGGAGIEDIQVQRGILIGARENALNAARGAEMILDRIRIRIDALNGQRSPDDPLVLADLPDNPILRLLDERSIALRDERFRAQSQPTIDGTSLAALDRAIASLRQSTLQSIGDYEARVAEDLASALDEIATLDSRLAALSANEAEWNTVQAELTLAREIHENSARRLSEAQSSEELRAERISNVAVIQQPTEARLATGTRNAVVLSVGGVFALLLATSWVVLRESLDSRVWRAEDVARGAGDLPLLGVTRRRWGRPVVDDIALTAASLGSICARRKIQSLAYMAVSHECSNPALRTRALAAGLIAMGLKDTEIINAGRWSERNRPTRKYADLTESTVSPGTLPIALSTLPDETENAGTLRIIAAPPLFSGVEAMKIAWVVDAVVFDIAAGADDLAEVEAAARWIKLNGGRAVGIILADVRPYAAHGPVVTA
ncbi:hypothetical protein OO012_09215 [Rhodobacteraceae bacterium KMM 6894]|nr:hypothetical protein [Rhodobacteraceae bacterium KMM 6894]